MSGGGRIGALVAKLEAMRTPAFREAVAKKMADETNRLYVADFDKGVDPYGKKWAPRAADVSAFHEQHMALKSAVDRAAANHAAKFSTKSKATLERAQARFAAHRTKFKGGQVLVRTGYLRASGEVEQVSAEGFRFRVYAPYATYQQTGTLRSPQRMIVPSARYGLGAWGAPFNRIVVAAIRGLMK